MESFNIIESLHRKIIGVQRIQKSTSNRMKALECADQPPGVKRVNEPAGVAEYRKSRPHRTVGRIL